MPKQSTKRKQPNPLATKPLPQAEPITASVPTPNHQTLSPTQATLTRLLSGTQPTTRQEAFLLIRWQRLANAQRQALAFEWDLPGEKREDKGLAKQAMGELGR